MSDRFLIEPLDPAHDRKAFSCGVPVFDHYFRELASQDVKRRVGNCFVACDASGSVAAYYTLAAASLPLTELPTEDAKRLPRHGLMPAGLIGRLAVDRRCGGRQLGGALVIDAARRVTRADPAIFALIVDAKDDNAVSFYLHLGFRRFARRPMSFFLPIATALDALGAAR